MKKLTLAFALAIVAAAPIATSADAQNYRPRYQRQMHRSPAPAPVINRHQSDVQAEAAMRERCRMQRGTIYTAGQWNSRNPGMEIPTGSIHCHRPAMTVRW